MLPKLRIDLDIMLSPLAERPGLLIRDAFRYSDQQFIIPPPLLTGLQLFDGKHTEADLEQELERVLINDGSAAVAKNLAAVLSQAGFLEDQTYADLKQRNIAAFIEAPSRQAAHAGSAYPSEAAPLRSLMQTYLGSQTQTAKRLVGIAAPHISPHGGWQSYRAAYRQLNQDLAERTFVVLGTSHYGQPEKFGLTRKPFTTPLGTTTPDLALVNELASQPAVLLEDYCHRFEHSIEFQVIFLQSIFGPAIRMLPILCGPLGKSAPLPEANHEVERFFAALAELAERHGPRLFWVLGVDMAHMGYRYGDNFSARANHDKMELVRRQDLLRIDRINASDAAGFWELIKENNDNLKWCGTSPFYAFMKALPQARGTTRRYQQWNIDQNSVVSFAALSFAPRSLAP